ncbi:MAG: ATP-binding protein [Verrucomicrobiales bacterium]|nr:ATP-binding protein [Verrucomicrobiales bacterium]
MPEIRHSDALERELHWFYQALETRLRLHFGQESPVRSLAELPPPELDGVPGPYPELIRRHAFGFRERLILALALAPHLRPALLDPFFTRNSTYDRPFTEFGGWSAAPGGFAPTVETALFLVAGESLEERLAASRFFLPEHPFHAESMLASAGSDGTASPAQVPLRPTPALLHTLLTGEPWQPRFGSDFPARRLTTQLDWEDLVLPHDTRERIEEILAWMRHGPHLLADWDLGRRLRPGLRGLFAGPAGTGKTLTAALLGKVSGRDVYRIDLSLVVSKYIGETEKNLERIFQQAENRDWILFFDEADALFGKRTQVSDAHDRFANQEVSYLLQRVEVFHGTVILATNLRDNLDEAFLRRFECIVNFPLPGPEELHRLWSSGFGRRCELAPDIDLDRLSQRYRLSGGSVMNVVRFCSLRAVRRNTRVVRLRDIEEGIRRELQKEGMTG